MTFDSAQLGRIKTLLSEAKKLVCVCHRNPDGDAIGSICGLGLLLQSAFPTTPIQLACVDSSPPTFSFLPSVAHITHALVPTQGDVYLFLDSAEPKLTEFHLTYPKIFGGAWPSICIDHHPTNTRYATENIVLVDASSTCEILLHIADALHWKLTPDIATALLTGVYTDTGGLVHSNTTSSVYLSVARLLREGADQQRIIQSVFRTAKISTLRLWGRVLEKIILTPEGGALSALTESDFKATGANYAELTGAIDYINAVPGMKFSLLLAEKEGKVRGSLRTLRDDVDVSRMASVFEGGGHKKAAGFSVPGKLVPEIRWKVEATDEVKIS